MKRLQDQRRSDTFRLIQDKALQLAAQTDAENVTVEAICEAAGVSVRTFFNYFPVREAAFVIVPPPFPEDAIAAFLTGKDTFLEALIVLLVTRLPRSRQERRALATVFASSARTPRLAALQISAMHEHEAELAALIQKRLSAQAGDPMPGQVAAAVLAVARLVITQWATSDDDQEIKATFAASMRNLAKLFGQ